jgi:hypothetical protein
MYRHFKGGRYEVIGVAKHADTEEELVVYRPLYGERVLTVRPKSRFLEYVEVGGERIPRFRFIGSS